MLEKFFWQYFDVIIGCGLDLIFGDPYWFPHPVRFMGWIISTEEIMIRKIFKGKSLYFGGFIIALFNITASFFVPFYILKLASTNFWLYRIVNIFLIYTIVAAKNLRDEAFKVYEALSLSLEKARYRLSFIVGRDTKNLDELEIIRATVETVSENTSDGVIAPLFYTIFGTPLGFMYKMVNTMDSMLGYMNQKYKYIGFFPAKIDDVFNFIPARLTGFLMLLSGFFFGYDVKYAFKIMIRDRKNHKSPNCAYPEGAIAGLLKVRLGGDNFYFGELVKKPTIGDGIKKLKKEDIIYTIKIMFTTEALFLMLVGIFMILINIFFKSSAFLI